MSQRICQLVYRKYKYLSTGCYFDVESRRISSGESYICYISSMSADMFQYTHFVFFPGLACKLGYPFLLSFSAEKVNTVLDSIFCLEHFFLDHRLELILRVLVNAAWFCRYSEVFWVHGEHVYVIHITQILFFCKIILEDP